MVIKRWSSAFLLMVVLPVLILRIDPTAFFVLMSLVTLAVTASSLRKLVILNFAPDSYIVYKGLQQTYVPATKKEAALKRVMLFGLHLLLLVFFAYSFFITDAVWLKAATVVVALCWFIDMLRTEVNAIRGGISDGEWTWRDTLAEGFIWFQNISSIVLVISVFAARFFF